MIGDLRDKTIRCADHEPGVCDPKHDPLGRVPCIVCGCLTADPRRTHSWCSGRRPKKPRGE